MKRMEEYFTLERLKTLIENDPNQPLGSADNLTDEDVQLVINQLRDFGLEELVNNSASYHNYDISKLPTMDLGIFKKQ